MSNNNDSDKYVICRKCKNWSGQIGSHNEWIQEGRRDPFEIAERVLLL